MCYVETDHHNCRPQGAIASAYCAERQLIWRNTRALFCPTRSGRCPFESHCGLKIIHLATSEKCRFRASKAALRSSNAQILSAFGGGNRCEENPSMRTLMPALAMMTLIGICSQANAQAQCPELTRLRSEAAEASKPTRRALISDRCEVYIRSSMAWGVMVQYANDHRDLCDISIRSLSEFEKYHREAVSARDNVCAGRPIRPFPPEIIQR